MTDPIWFNEHQMAAYIAMPVETVRTWRKRSRGPIFYKFGRRIRYAKTDLDAWIATCAVVTNITPGTIHDESQEETACVERDRPEPDVA